MKVFEYLNGDVFTAQVNGHSADNCLENPLLRLVCVNHHNVGFKIFEIFYSINCDIKKNATAKWFPMKTNDIQDLGFIRLFSAPLGNLDFNRQYQIRFCVKIASIVENFRNKMVDKNWMTQLWSAQTDRQLTDVEIRIGSKKLEAHRVILSARSPVMDKLIREQLRSGNEPVKSTINVCANVNVSIFEHFLKFLYMGCQRPQ
jgi:speckle-type POZ protein